MLYICPKFHENIIDDIKVIEWTRFSLEIFQRGIIPRILKMELQFIFSAHYLIMVYFVPSFMKVSLTVFKL